MESRSAISAYYEWRDQFNIGIELEVAYDVEKRITTEFECFEEDDDLSISTNVSSAHAGEFVLRNEYMKYFQHKKVIDEEIKKLLTICYPNNSSCGTHVHMSHPGIKLDEFPGFLEYFTNYWVEVSQEKMRKKYPQVRDSTKYAEDNTGYSEDKTTRYKQMNIMPSFPGYDYYDGTVHVEFRGYEGLPNPDAKEYKAVKEFAAKDVTGFGAVVEMEMLTYYIEDLCDEFVTAFHNFTKSSPNDISKSLQLVADTKRLEVARTIATHIQHWTNEEKTTFDLILDELRTPGFKNSEEEDVMQKYFQTTDIYEIPENFNLFTFILSSIISSKKESQVTIWGDTATLLDIVNDETWEKSYIFLEETGIYVTPFAILWQRNQLLAKELLEDRALAEKQLLLDVRDLLAISVNYSSYLDFKAVMSKLQYSVVNSWSVKKLWRKVYNDLKSFYTDNEINAKFFALEDVTFMGIAWVQEWAHVWFNQIVSINLFDDMEESEIQKIKDDLSFFGKRFVIHWNWFTSEHADFKLYSIQDTDTSSDEDIDNEQIAMNSEEESSERKRLRDASSNGSAAARRKKLRTQFMRQRLPVKNEALYFNLRF